MSKHENHQFIEMNSGRNEGKMAYKDVMCPECGEQRRMNENGTVEMMKKGKMEDMKDKEE